MCVRCLGRVCCPARGGSRGAGRATLYRAAAECWPAPDDEANSYRLRARSRSEVPPNTLVYVEVEASTPFDGSAVLPRIVGMREGKEWVIPNNLVKFRSGRARVPLLNTTDRELTFHPGQRLGRVETLPSENEGVLLAEESGDVPGRFEGMTYEDVITGVELSDDQRKQLFSVLEKHRACFPSSCRRYGTTNAAAHRIATTGVEPIRVAPRRCPPSAREEIRRQVFEMIEDGVAEESFSPWAAPVVLVKRKDGRLRFCVDYRRLNEVTVKDAYPLPRVDDLLDHVGDARIFTSLDLASGYWQVPVHPEDREKTAFVTPDGLYQFRQMPFGLCNAPATFQRLMDRVLGRLKWEMCLVYMDDVLIFGAGFREHLARLDSVLSAVQSAGLTLNISKCRFCVREIAYLGHILSDGNIRPDERNIQAIMSIQRPQNVSEVRSFLGAAGYYRRFVHNFAQLERPLAHLLKKKTEWKWSGEQEQAFEAIKRAVVGPAVLRVFSQSAETILRTDASGVGLGAVLAQVVDGVERPVLFLSRRLTDVETRYHSNEQECLALTWALERLRAYLLNRRFTVFTDNTALKWLWAKQATSGKFARWVVQLQEFDFVISHVSAAQNKVADCLSRSPTDPPEATVPDEPAVYLFEKAVTPKRYFALCQQGDATLRALFDQASATPDGVDSRYGRLILKKGVLYQVNPGRGASPSFCRANCVSPPNPRVVPR